MIERLGYFNIILKSLELFSLIGFLVLFFLERTGYGRESIEPGFLIQGGNRDADGSQRACDFNLEGLKNLAPMILLDCSA